MASAACRGPPPPEEHESGPGPLLPRGLLITGAWGLGGRAPGVRAEPHHGQRDPGSKWPLTRFQLTEQSPGPGLCVAPPGGQAPGGRVPYGSGAGQRADTGLRGTAEPAHRWKSSLLISEKPLQSLFRNDSQGPSRREISPLNARSGLRPRFITHRPLATLPDVQR